jgi:hypothetical protein
MAAMRPPSGWGFRAKRIAAWCRVHANTFKSALDSTKAVVEIGAILIGGWWAYNLFVKKDAPSLEKRARTESSLTWSPTPDAHACRADFHVELQNIGTTGFDVTLVRVRAWQFPSDRLPPDEKLRLIDVNDVFETEPIFDRNFDEPPTVYKWVPFVQHYPPGTKWDQSLEFLVPKSPLTRTLFLVQFFERGQTVDGDPLEGTYAWEPTCGE